MAEDGRSLGLPWAWLYHCGCHAARRRIRTEGRLVFTIPCVGLGPAHVDLLGRRGVVGRPSRRGAAAQAHARAAVAGRLVRAVRLRAAAGSRGDAADEGEHAAAKAKAKAKAKARGREDNANARRKEKGAAVEAIRGECEGGCLAAAFLTSRIPADRRAARRAAS